MYSRQYTPMSGNFVQPMNGGYPQIDAGLYKIPIEYQYIYDQNQFAEFSPHFQDQQYGQQNYMMNYVQENNDPNKYYYQQQQQPYEYQNGYSIGVSQPQYHSSYQSYMQSPLMEKKMEMSSCDRNIQLNQFAAKKSAKRKGSKSDCPCDQCQAEIHGGFPVTIKQAHVCPVSGCSKSYPKSQHLKAHVTWHDKDRVHRCPVCKDKFQGTAILEVHLQEHTARGERAQPQLKKRRRKTPDEISNKLRRY
ncbi:hypothetical protein ACOME3_001068 [Neoechinorhynchus agilis]